MLCQCAARPFHFEKGSAENFRQKRAQISPIGGSLCARAQMRFANLKSPAGRRGRNRCQSAAIRAGAPRGILLKNLLQQLSGESEIRSHGVLQLLPIERPMKRSKHAAVQKPLHFLARITGRNQIEAQVQHRLDQTINPLTSLHRGMGRR